MYEQEVDRSAVGIWLKALISSVIALLITIPLAAVLATLGIIASHWFFEFLLAVVLGFLIGGIFNLLFRLFKVRGSGLLKIFCFIVAAVGAYVYLGAYLLATVYWLEAGDVWGDFLFNPREYILSLETILLRPLYLLQGVNEFFALALRTGGEGFIGALAIWIEPVLVLIFGTISAKQHRRPFDEKGNSWMKRSKNPIYLNPLSAAEITQLKADFAAGNLSALLNPRDVASDRHWTEFYTYTLGSGEYAGIVELVSVTPGRKGSLNRKVVLGPMTVDQRSLSTIIQTRMDGSLSDAIRAGSSSPRAEASTADQVDTELGNKTE